MVQMIFHFNGDWFFRFQPWVSCESWKTLLDTSRLDPGNKNTWKTRDIMKVKRGFPSLEYLPTVNQGLGMPQDQWLLVHNFLGHPPLIIKKYSSSRQNKSV